MRALALAAVMLVATPTLAAEPEALRHHPRPQGTPVVVEREALLRRLTQLEETLTDALEKGRRGQQSKQQLRRALEELEDLQEVVEGAPVVANTPTPPGPNPGPLPPPPGQPVVRPLPDDAFNRLATAMKGQTFGEDKMRLLRDATGRHYFLVTHVQQLLTQFSFSRERLEVVRMMWPRVLDRENGSQLYGAFTFRDEKRQLEDILDG